MSNMQSINIPNSSFGYSALNIDDLEAQEYTLVTIVCDVSSSVENFKNEMEKCIAETIKACKKSPRAENLLVRFVTFNQHVEEKHGFKLLSQIGDKDYNNSLNISGMTALYDACTNAVQSASDYGQRMIGEEFSVNSIIFVITDGCENRSSNQLQDVISSLENIVINESLESLMTILIGVNIDNPNVSQGLKIFKENANLTQYIELQNANEKTLSKLAQFISQSISSQSQALGSGSPSAPISFNRSLTF